MLTLDLGVFHKRGHTVGFKESLSWCGFWILLALAFNVIVYFWHGTQASLEFFTGYLLEYSLSIDNIFVFLLLTSYFKVPPRYQHRVLFWGIIGALILRGLLIIAGIALINLFHWVLYAFGAVLILSGLKMACSAEKKIDPSKNPVLKFLRRVIPLSDDYDEDRFFIRRAGRLLATPLLVVLIFIELTDLVFAFDSIPAIIGITRDAFVVYTSNVFAIFGLRSLYFALANLVGMFRYLPYGLAAVLIFVGIKMCIEPFYRVEVLASLTVIGSILCVAIVASLIARRYQPEKAESAEQES
ncbi:TerC family protein [bacterium]|nr:TerC family protein [bacterium]